MNTDARTENVERPILERGLGCRSIYASREIRETLLRNGIGTLEDLFQKGGGAEARHTGRSVYARPLDDGADSASRAFIKLCSGQRRWPRMSDLKTGQAFQSLPMREWNGLGVFSELGLHVPERLAVFNEGRWNYRGAVVVREAPVSASVSDMQLNGDWDGLPRLDRLAILDAVVAATRRIHAGGFGWRGASSRHYLPERLDDGTWRVWLIDCEGVHRGRGKKVVARDFRKLVRSMRESCRWAKSRVKTLEALEERIVDGG